MSARPLPATGGAAAEDQLLAQLGLPASASPEDLDNLHDAVSAYLAAAPSGIRGWAHAQAAALDAAYLSLTDPVGLEGSALRSPTRPPAVVPGGPATPPVRRDSLPADVPVAAAVVAADTTDDQDDEADDEGDADDDELDLEPGAETDAEALAALYASVTPSAHADMAPATTARPTKKERREARRQTAAAPPPAAAFATAQPNIWKRAFLGTVAVVAVVGIAFGANTMVNGTGLGAAAATTPPAAAATPPAIDQAKVSDLMGKYQANPNDTATLLALADEFYKGEQFDVAGQWLDKVLAVDPKNVQGLLARGAIYFNLNDVANAEKAWTSVTTIDPKNTEAWYDLGFMAFYQAQPDYDAVQRYWGKVIELDPQSAMGQQVQAHLDALVKNSMIPAPSGAPAASPAPSGAAVSPAPSGSPQADVLQQTAKDIAFGVTELAAQADTPFTIHFDNQDTVPHDIVIKDASGAEVFTGELITGPKAVDYAVPALKAGAYTFNCSIHPNMTGTLTVGS